MIARSVGSNDHQLIQSKAAWGDRILTRRGRMSIAMLGIVFAGVIWSLVASFFVWRWEDAHAEEEVTEIANGHFLALQNGLDEYLSKLVALRAFFESADIVTRTEFDVFAGRFLEA